MKIKYGYHASHMMGPTFTVVNSEAIKPDTSWKLIKHHLVSLNPMKKTMTMSEQEPGMTPMVIFQFLWRKD